MSRESVVTHYATAAQIWPPNLRCSA